MTDEQIIHGEGPIANFAIRIEREFTRLAIALEEAYRRNRDQAAVIAVLHDRIAELEHQRTRQLQAQEGSRDE